MTGEAQSLTRVASDERGPRTAYEDIEIGTDLGRAEWRVSRERIQALCETDDDYHEWYSVGSPFGGIIAPALMAYPPVRLLFSGRYNVRGLFYDLQLRNLSPIRPDRKMLVGGRIVDKWIKRDREFVAYEGWARDEDGVEIFRTRRAHVLDYIPRTAPRNRVALDSGNIVLPADDALRRVEGQAAAPRTPEEAANPPARPEPSGLALVRADTPLGWPLPQVSRQMSLQQFRDRHYLLYGNNVWPEKNLHADAEAAKLEGLKAPVAAAPTIFAMITRAMMTTFAEGWVVGGDLAVKIVKPVYPHNFITAKGRVVERMAEPDGARLVCEVWAENEDGEKVVVGKASGVARA